MEKLDFDLVRIPVWVQLNVPLELYAKIGLSYIASALGSSLYMDSVTANRERFEYAKVCVEIEACATIPQFIDVLLRDGRVHPVQVVVPWLLSSCSKCKVFGHSVKICSGKDTKVVQVWKQKTPIVNEVHVTISECGEPSGKDIDVVVNQVDIAVSDAITRGASDFETIPDGQTDASPR
ncbi:hypothetical protein V6N13_058749 [Hibiscus sabdariffa]